MVDWSRHFEVQNSGTHITMRVTLPSKRKRESMGDSDSPPATIPRLGCSANEFICLRCKSINLERIFRNSVSSSYGSYIVTLGRASYLLESNCLLCQLFASITPSDFDRNSSPRDDFCHLYAFSSSRMYAGLNGLALKSFQDSIMLGVTRIPPPRRMDTWTWHQMSQSLKETGYICRVDALASEEWDPDASTFQVRLVPPKVDLRLARKWLNYCINQHTNRCVPRNPLAVLPARLIDCKSRSIVKTSPHSSYLALSYVWGQDSLETGAKQPQLDGSTLSKVPLVVEDSMKVTLGLGFRYLWVDQYCINQNDPEEQHHEIQNMDSIYANAQATIIAAAGQDANFGLPGVSSTARKPQASLKLDGKVLIRTMPDAK